MKRTLFSIAVFIAILYFINTCAYCQIDILGKVKREVGKKTDEAIDDALHPKQKEEPKKDTTAKQELGKNAGQNSDTQQQPTASPTGPDAFKAYANYDFIPGDTILFEDNFASDDDGEFPAHWQLLTGQGVVNKVEGEPTFVMTTYTRVAPRIKAKSYLTDPFTFEYDYYLRSTGYDDPSAPHFWIKDSGGKDYLAEFSTRVYLWGTPNGLSAYYPGDKQALAGKWHHASFGYKKHQIKCYIDQTRVLAMPDCGYTPASLYFIGEGDENHPSMFRNVRIAKGGGMKMMNKLSTDGKIITHGILFNVGKATIKPESMGTINGIVKLLLENPDVKFSIEGHTDSDGDRAKNQKLSEDRATAVKDLLVHSGIDASRLSTKGFGASKPIDDNTTLEGKANNRRVEFVKM
jgi:hypothetical protein